MKRVRGGPECWCGQPAQKLTVHKEGINKGRTFFSCRECKFFDWTSEPKKNWLTVLQDRKKAQKTERCVCKSGPQTFQSQQGLNKGRWFETCKKCKYFKWGDCTEAAEGHEEPEPEPAPTPLPSYTVDLGGFDSVSAWNTPYYPIHILEGYDSNGKRIG